MDISGKFTLINNIYLHEIWHKIFAENVKNGNNRNIKGINIYTKILDAPARIWI